MIDRDAAGESWTGAARRVAWRRPVAALELVLWLSGSGLLGLCVWAKADEIWFQRQASDELAVRWATARGAPRETRTAAVAVGTPIARLSIPRLGETAVVAEGTDATVLRRAVGHVPGSARPGGPGNVALAGHRDSFFRHLGALAIGDAIVIDSDAQRATYRVEWSRIVDPSAVEVLAPTDYPAVTLVTCYPFRYLGDAPRRYVVRGRRVDGGEKILQSARDSRPVGPRPPSPGGVATRVARAKPVAARDLSPSPAVRPAARRRGIRLAS